MLNAMCTKCIAQYIKWISKSGLECPCQEYTAAVTPRQVNDSANNNAAITAPNPKNQLSCSNEGSISILDDTSAGGVKQLIDRYIFPDDLGMDGPVQV